MGLGQLVRPTLQQTLELTTLQRPRPTQLKQEKQRPEKQRPEKQRPAHQMLSLMVKQQQKQLFGMRTERMQKQQQGGKTGNE